MRCFEMKLSETCGIQYVLYFPAVQFPNEESQGMKWLLLGSLEQFSWNVFRFYLTLSYSPRILLYIVILLPLFLFNLYIFLLEHRVKSKHENSRQLWSLPWLTFELYMFSCFSSALQRNLLLIVGLLWLSNL